MRVLKKFWIVMAAVMGVFVSAGVTADASYREQMKGLDEQVQEVKSDVLSIAAELNQLEEKLLYPSNTHVAVFVALAQGETFRLDAVQIQIDGQPAAHYIYSFKELEALQKGGVQRIYTGNVATGQHQIEVSLNGKLESGKEYSRTERFPFSKGVEPKLLGVTLAGPIRQARSSETGTSACRARTLIVGLALAACWPRVLAPARICAISISERRLSRASGPLLRSARAARCGAGPASRARRAAARFAALPHRQAEFSVGDFELYYRMHHRAGRAIRAVLEGDVEESVRNEAAFRLARIHFQKDQPENALTALDRINGKVPEAIHDDVEFLRANVYMALGRPADAADVLKRLQGAQA